jgi:hypothetical protein
MRFFSFTQLAVSAIWCRCFFVILRPFFVEVAASTPYTSKGLLTVCPDIAELLAVITLY